MGKTASRERQISAFVSETTAELLERFARMQGQKKGYIVEQALRQYMSTADEIPQQYLIPTRIVLTNDSFDRLTDRIDHPRKPTKAMRDLMKRAKKYLPR